jgi:nucleotide-binding universal stress UspA family protein
VSGPILVCTDGSAAAVRALRAGLGLVAADAQLVVVTAVETAHPMMVTGTGHAGGVMTEEQYATSLAASRAEGERIVEETLRELDLGDAAGEVLEGSAGPAVCRYAEEVGARGIVIGTRGHGGLRRAVLGSVSDHVVRNAPCPVVVTN